MLKCSPKSSIGKAKSKVHDSHMPNLARYTNPRTLHSLYSMVPNALCSQATASRVAASVRVNDQVEPPRVWNCNKPKKTENNPYNVYSKQRNKLSGKSGSKTSIRRWVHPPYPVYRSKDGDGKKREGSHNYESFYVPYEQDDTTIANHVAVNPRTEKEEPAEEPRSRSFKRLQTAGVRYALKIAEMGSLIEEVKSRTMAANDGEPKSVKNAPLLLPPSQFAEDPIESGKRFVLLRSRTAMRFSTLDCDKLLHKYACHLPFVQDPSKPDVKRPKLNRLSCRPPCEEELKGIHA
ncbi:uncharacterized protein LOC122623714 [Drosophila teissieri]|uniref:uncharacterized protein LOC122623714 n=1 Tax=Drosophila teissieri TaxID=7243 RepID=UPI001CBA5485|nr:uncharacterized protein LOC122623714 [Drosophila teissieri]